MTNQPVTILALECSTSGCSVAIGAGDRLLADVRPQGRNQAEALLPAVREALRQAGLDWPQIGALAVTVGPGSFTGLRIGLAAARGLALARGLPVIGVTTAELLAHAVADDVLAGRRLLVAIDSRRDDLFVQPFSPARRPLAEIRALTPAQALRWLPGPLLVAGDAAARFAGLADDVEILSLLPQAAGLLTLAERHWRAGDGLAAQPLYLRPPDVTPPA